MQFRQKTQREKAKENIYKILEKKIKGILKRPKESGKYHEGDLVAIERNQFGRRLELRQKTSVP